MGLPTQNGAVTLEKAVFTVSIDFELMWGTADRHYSGKFRDLCEMERNEVIPRLLEALAEFGISATWAIVGHLFLPEPATAGFDPTTLPGRASGHASGLGPVRAGGLIDTCPHLFYGADLVESVRRCRVPQDIGSHTFSHLVLGHPSCSKSMAEEDLARCVKLAAEAGMELKSFIFPRNRVGHLDVVRKFGFSSYRGPEPRWYSERRRTVRRLGHLLDIASLTTPPSVVPRFEDGIWNIPGSMLYTPSFGPRRFVPVWMRVLRARRGLDAAARNRQLFHLWFHPTDLACRMDAMIDGLRKIFAHAARLRDSGRLAILPMCDLAGPRPAAARQPEAAVVT